MATTRRFHGDRECTTTMVRRSDRAGGKVRDRTLANLSHLPKKLLGPACRERDVARALICSQVLEPSSKAS